MCVHLLIATLYLLVFFSTNCKMSSSVGGFTAPSMITHFCLRTPEEVSDSRDAREFTPTALFSPLLSFGVLIATYLAGDHQKKVDDETIEFGDEKSNEKTPLLAVGNGKLKPGQRRKTENDKDEATPPKKKGPIRRRTLMEEARAASVRCSMMSTPFDLPGKIFDSDYSLDSGDSQLNLADENI